MMLRRQRAQTGRGIGRIAAPSAILPHALAPTYHSTRLRAHAACWRSLPSWRSAYALYQLSPPAYARYTGCRRAAALAFHHAAARANLRIVRTALPAPLYSRPGAYFLTRQPNALSPSIAHAHRALRAACAVTTGCCHYVPGTHPSYQASPRLPPSRSRQQLGRGCGSGSPCCASRQACLGLNTRRLPGIPSSMAPWRLPGGYHSAAGLW